MDTLSSEHPRGTLLETFSILKFYSTTQQVACNFREAGGKLH